MIVLNLMLFLIFLSVLIKSADYLVKFSSRFARILKFPEFIVSFFIIAFISVLPESTVSIISALNGEPGLGLGTLLGSNVADLTLVFGMVAFFSYKGIQVKSKILRNNFFYLMLLLFPLILGFDGRFSRLDGIILILAGFIFLGKIYTDRKRFHKQSKKMRKGSIFKTFIFLVISLLVLLMSAFFTVKYAINFASDVKMPSILIGATILAFGTCLPELIFSIKAVRKNRDELALGDLLGTVILDATVILGVVALISPFNHNLSDLYAIGTAMFFAGIIVVMFMKSDKLLNKLEGLLLILFYILFVFLEFFVNNLI